MFAEYERAKMLERSRRGKRHRAQTGAVSVLSRAPFGYRYITREAGGGAARYEIDEDAARIVRQIFTWVGYERLSLAAVCRRLLGQDIPSPAGNRHWSRAMIHTMLLNPAYVGQAIYGRRQCLPWQPPLHPPRGHAGVLKRPYRQVPAPAERHISVAVPAIVDAELFTSAAERLQENRNAIASGWRAFNTCCAVCLYVRRADMGLPVTTIRGGGATIDAVAPIAAASTVSPVVMRGWLRSSRLMMPCGPRFVGCWKTPRS
jgi:hypothetical protein